MLNSNVDEGGHPLCQVDSFVVDKLDGKRQGAICLSVLWGGFYVTLTPWMDIDANYLYLPLPLSASFLLWLQ